MPYTDPCDSVIAQLTDAGRNAFARVTLGELTFTPVSFAVGRGGYVDANPVKVEAIDGSLVALIDQIFPTVIGTGKAMESFEQPNSQSLVLNCRLSASEAVYGLGELGIFAEILTSSVPTEVGTTFLFAVAHYPLQSKTNRHVYLNRIIIQF
jgi:hypothetical protein